jgi:uncharacterized phosphosugar-binding protein
MTPLTFPEQLNRVRDRLVAQTDALHAVAQIYADALQSGGLVHVYANGHSRIAVEEMCIRMGALTGFHPLLQAGLTTFTDVVGPNGIRLNQAVEQLEGLGEKLLAEFDVGPGEPLLVVSATGQTPAAVDMAHAWLRRYPENPLIVLCCREQSDLGRPKHSCGKNLTHLAREAKRGHILDNGMPMGDMSVTVEGGEESYLICPLSSLGAIGVVHCLNELTLRELDRRGHRHPVLRNMHLKDTSDNYEAWIQDQRTRYARALRHPAPVPPSRA